MAYRADAGSHSTLADSARLEKNLVRLAPGPLYIFRIMLSSVASKSVRRPATRLTRTFSSSGSKCDAKPVMNRYSRIVTQPKDQGASQVSCSQYFHVSPAELMHRQCCTRRMASAAMLTFKKPWLALVVSGNQFTVLLAFILPHLCCRYEGNP